MGTRERTIPITHVSQTSETNTIYYPMSRKDKLNKSLVVDPSERVFSINFRIPNNDFFFNSGLFRRIRFQCLVPWTSETEISGSIRIQEEISGNKEKDNSDNTCFPNK